jgi:hypothetical protein
MLTQLGSSTLRLFVPDTLGPVKLARLDTQGLTTRFQTSYMPLEIERDLGFCHFVPQFPCVNAEFPREGPTVYHISPGDVVSIPLHLNESAL